jgi:PTH1 family peptidyl-tRNA hydrolase
MKIIFAQGNPLPGYINTRHDAGFVIINALAKSYDVDWHKNTKFNAHIAEINLPEEKVILVRPDTYYNNTGISARAVLDFYKLNASDDILVLHDELMLPFGTIRVRNSGRDAGNNGIKSLNAHIGSEFHRVRIGIENDLRLKMDADEFVLANFSAEEKTFLNEKITPYVISIVEDFIAGRNMHGNITLEK